jgi:hypothetical protein
MATEFGQLGGARSAAAAGQRAHAGFELVEVEGLGQVVVGAGVQAQHPVAHGAARGEDQHRGAQALGARPRQHLQAVQARQAEIEQYDIRHRRAPAVQRTGAVAAHRHLHPAALEAALQGGLHRGVVFDQEQLHRGRIIRRPLVFPDRADSRLTAPRRKMPTLTSHRRPPCVAIPSSSPWPRWRPLARCR